MGGVYSTNNNDKYECLINKYNKMRSNYETEKVYSSSLKENIENLENKIVNNEIKIDSMEKENEDNLKICESLKSNYESKLINKDNLINDLENSMEYNDTLINKHDKIIENLQSKISKLSNENKNILYLENKLKLIEDTSKTQECIIEDYKESNILLIQEKNNLEDKNQ